MDHQTADLLYRAEECVLRAIAELQTAARALHRAGSLSSLPLGERSSCSVAGDHYRQLASQARRRADILASLFGEASACLEPADASEPPPF